MTCKACVIAEAASQDVYFNFATGRNPDGDPLYKKMKSVKETVHMVAAKELGITRCTKIAIPKTKPTPVKCETMGCKNLTTNGGRCATCLVAYRSGQRSSGGSS